MASGELKEQESLLAFDDVEEEDEELADSSMSLVDHLEELRWRILKSVAAIVVGTIVAFIFREPIMTLLTWPLPSNFNPITKGHLVITGIAEGFTVFLFLSFAVGIVIALPVILYQAWAFIAPGLYQHEKKHAGPFILIGLTLFTMGITLGFFVLRYPMEFLVSFAANTFTELVSANSYFTFVAFFMLAFGIIFEIPLVLTFMARVGWISAETLKKKRASAHVGMWIASTFLTPGADIYSPLILSAVMSGLYELSIFFIQKTVKPEVEEAYS